MQRFLDLLFPPRADELLLRNTHPNTLAERMVLFESPATQPSCLCLLPYPDGHVQAAIREAKYHGNKQAFALLSETLVTALQSKALSQEAQLVPVPLGQARLRERGYNQIEEVSRRTAKTTGLPVNTECLVRTRETASQVSLPRHERQENVRGAFGAPHPLDPCILYIVCDDVLTTGATLQEAIYALRTAGAAHILPLALAH